MSVKDKVITSFLDSVKIGDTVTKGEIFRTAAKVIPDLCEATVGWIISIWLVDKGCIVEVGEGKHGAKIYRRVG